METANVNLKNLRAAVKNAKTPCALVKTLYVYAETDKWLKSALPAKKQTLIDLIPTICEKYSVGGTKTVNMKNGQTRNYTIKFSSDMVLRYIAEQAKSAK